MSGAGHINSDNNVDNTIVDRRDAELIALRAQLQHTKQMLLAEETIRRMLERPALAASPSGGLVAAPPPRSVAAIIEQQPLSSSLRHASSSSSSTSSSAAGLLATPRTARASISSSSAPSSLPGAAESDGQVALIESLTQRLAQATLQQQLALTSVESMKRLYAQLHARLADSQAHAVLQATNFAAELERERSMRRLIDEELLFMRRKLDAFEAAAAASGAASTTAPHPVLLPDSRQDLFKELRERVLDHTRSALEQEQREVAMLAESKRNLVEELEQLSQTLFEEANQMCSDANRAAHDAVVRGDELADQLSLTRMRLGLMQFAALRQASGADKSRSDSLTPRGTKSSLIIDASPVRAIASSVSLSVTPHAVDFVESDTDTMASTTTRNFRRAVRREPNIVFGNDNNDNNNDDDNDDDDEAVGATRLKTWSPQKSVLRREMSTGLPLPASLSTKTAVPVSPAPISDPLPPLERLSCDNSLVRVLALPMGPQPSRCSFAVYAKVTRDSSLAHSEFTAVKDGGAPLRQLRAAVEQCALGAPPHSDARRALVQRLLNVRRDEPLAAVAPPSGAQSDVGDEVCALCSERAAPPVYGLMLNGDGGVRRALGAACFERVALVLQLCALQRALRDAADDGTKSALFFELQRQRVLVSSVAAWTSDHCAAFNST
jgi:hypothetical protein